jgi:sec-independent protein translocase protein TatA
MSIGFWQIAIVVILVVLLFGRGKISSLMGDVAKGIKSFKRGMATDATEDLEPKNISETNQDTNTNQDSNTNQDTSNKD